MEIKGKVNCLFEQSGTFKNEFIKLGIPAEDYDIQNNFAQTDYVIDLFAEIEKAYQGGASIFDDITPDDLVLAFFPCIYFCENNMLYFTAATCNYRCKSRAQIIEDILNRRRSRQSFYELAIKLFFVCESRHIRLITENPYSASHYWRNNFPYAPTIIDTNRTRRGDYFNKPTAFYFINCEPTHGCSYQKPKEHKEIRHCASGAHAGLCSEERSMISPDYARNFICDFILGKEQPHTERTLFD